MRIWERDKNWNAFSAALQICRRRCRVNAMRVHTAAKHIKNKEKKRNLNYGTKDSEYKTTKEYTKKRIHIRTYAIHTERGSFWVRTKKERRNDKCIMKAKQKNSHTEWKREQKRISSQERLSTARIERGDKMRLFSPKTHASSRSTRYYRHQDQPF